MPENKILRILVIDSHPQTATSISTILGDAGYQAEEAYNDKRARASLSDDGFSLIIVDAAVELGNIKESSHPKIIVTGFDTPKEKIKKFKM